MTEHQWKNQTAEDLRKWEEVDAIRKKFEDLKAQGEAARFSPAWIDLILETGGRIQFRPHAEAPAPYCGDEEVRDIPDPVFKGVDWLAIRPRIQSAPRIVRPGPID